LMLPPDVLMFPAPPGGPNAPIAAAAATCLWIGPGRARSKRLGDWH